MQAPVSVIYLVHESPHGSSVLPSTVAEAVGRATLRRWYTRTCSLQQAQPNDHPLAGGLLHHLLTLTCSIRSTGGYFLLPSPTVTNSFHFQKWSALCCPDFPLVSKTPATDRGSAFGCKITKSRAQNKETRFFFCRDRVFSRSHGPRAYCPFTVPEPAIAELVEASKGHLYGP